MNRIINKMTMLVKQLIITEKDTKCYIIHTLCANLALQSVIEHWNGLLSS